jgi:hypothetical protein
MKKSANKEITDAHKSQISDEEILYSLEEGEYMMDQFIIDTGLRASNFSYDYN